MTIEERIAAAIAASRTGTTAGWRVYRADARRMIAHYGEIVAARSDGTAKKPRDFSRKRPG